MPNKKQDIKEIIKDVANQDDEAKNKTEDLIQLVVFRLDNEEYGVNITELKEISRLLDITPVPNSPEFIKGIMNLRGKVSVVIDLEKRFNLVRENKADNSQKHIIVSEIEGNTFGVIVDQVTEVLRIPVSSIKKAPSLVSAKINSDFVTGVAIVEVEDDEENNEINKKKKSVSKKDDSRLVILIDLFKMLSEKELLELGSLTKDIQESNK